MTARRPSKRDYPRHVRVAEEVRKAVAAELDRLDDDRLLGVAVTGADLDRELRHGVIYVDALSADAAAAEDALGEHRVQLQRAVAGRARLRHTPVLEFRVDQSIESGDRIEQILAGLEIPPPDPEGDGPEDG